MWLNIYLPDDDYNLNFTPARESERASIGERISYNIERGSFMYL